MGSRFIDQPEIERVLRRGLARYPNVTLHLGATVSGVTTTGGGADVHAVQDGAPLTVHATWVVGADGGRSLVREAVGTTMETLAPARRWVIVDTVLTDPAHAARLPSGFRYVLTPDHLTLYAHGHGLHRRWEFRVPDGAPDPDEATVLGWLRAQVDTSLVRVTRIAPYAHRSLVAHTWRRGPLLLAGDAAHLMPPFAGQGMCSGIRDAVGLAWRLAAVVHGEADEGVLDAWVEERRAHVRDVTRGALFLGRLLEGDTPGRQWMRRRLLGLAQLGPVVSLLRRRGVRRPPLHGGTLGDDATAGTHVPEARLVGAEGPTTLDAQLGPRGALVGRRGALGPDDHAWATAQGLAPLVLGEQVGDPDGTLQRWLGAHEVAVVRPDRVVFASGARADLPALRTAWSRALRSPRAASPPSRAPGR